MGILLQALEDGTNPKRERRGCPTLALQACVSIFAALYMRIRKTYNLSMCNQVSNGRRLVTGAL
jgi:hypothetical protein